ncbi:branched-chain amino acid ABC transporter permease [Dichotomicrobium thermohalophilum]|uniref:Amino acid/amide ABC transporter membrane protein 1 (HAAT family) n=1 Tax=Dichotomicrobium thermohalophilum TaxID=933063 RepID=A0A397PAJ8_9HYPH|nr:branched-chain amino acid ABC transporter permease [Dichotomicrobium thermohalophilum]RIA45413.1 amino acid/amide ABC transporter membrane protein 1 (HAAT family) [Dichotomicrobium thermohalophilum]
MESVVAALWNSLELGVLLFLIAVGLNIIFGVLNIINFAHGALYMLGAYAAFTLTGLLGLPFWIALIAGPLLVAVLAAVVERVMLHNIYDRPITDTLLLTFALLLIIDEAVKWVWGTGIHIVEPPEILAGTFSLLGTQQSVYSLFVLAVGIVVGGGLWLFFTRTLAGKVMRAAASDRKMSRLVGINVPLVFTAVFALGAGIAALGGVIAAPIRAISPGMGSNIIVESFIVVVIGGLGSFPGAFLGAIVLGAIHGFGSRFLPELNIVLPFIGMAVVLLLKPQGLMGRSAI